MPEPSDVRPMAPNPEYKPKLDLVGCDAVTVARSKLSGKFELCKACAPEAIAQCRTEKIVAALRRSDAFEHMSSDLASLALSELSNIAGQLEQSYKSRHAAKSPPDLKDLLKRKRGEKIDPADKYDGDVYRCVMAARRKAERIKRAPGEVLAPPDAEKLFSIVLNVCQVLEVYCQANDPWKPSTGEAGKRGSLHTIEGADTKTTRSQKPKLPRDGGR